MGTWIIIQMNRVTIEREITKTKFLLFKGMCSGARQSKQKKQHLALFGGETEIVKCCGGNAGDAKRAIGCRFQGLTVRLDPAQ